MIFWAEDFNEDGATGGYFLRSDIKEFIDKLNNMGEKVVGISYDGSYNLEFLTKNAEGKKTLDEKLWDKLVKEFSPLQDDNMTAKRVFNYVQKLIANEYKIKRGKNE